MNSILGGVNLTCLWDVQLEKSIRIYYIWVWNSKMRSSPEIDNCESSAYNLNWRVFNGLNAMGPEETLYLWWGEEVQSWRYHPIVKVIHDTSEVVAAVVLWSSCIHSHNRGTGSRPLWVGQKSKRKAPGRPPPSLKNHSSLSINRGSGYHGISRKYPPQSGVPSPGTEQWRLWIDWEGSEELAPSIWIEYLVLTIYRAKIIIRPSLSQTSVSKSASLLF